jgi:hypothetical protein
MTNEARPDKANARVGDVWQDKDTGREWVFTGKAWMLIQTKDERIAELEEEVARLKAANEVLEADRHIDHDDDTTWDGTFTRSPKKRRVVGRIYTPSTEPTVDTEALAEEAERGYDPAQITGPVRRMAEEWVHPKGGRVHFQVVDGMVARDLLVDALESGGFVAADPWSSGR